MSHHDNTPREYRPIEDFPIYRDWSSRVIHDQWQRNPPYRGSVSPTLMTFGSIDVGKQSATQHGTITNTGSRPLRVLSITSVGEFLVTHNCPPVLERGGVVDIAVVFSPQRGGQAQGGIYVNTGDARGTEFIELLGFGVGSGGGGGTTLPSLSISNGILEDGDGGGGGDPIDPPDPEPEPGVLAVIPTSLVYPSVIVGQVSPIMTVQITNGTSVATALSAITVPAEFETLDVSLVGTSLLPNTSASIRVRFKPVVTAGPKSGVMEIVTTGKTFSVPLNGVALPKPAMIRLKTGGNQFVRTTDGMAVPLNSVNWFGAEGTNHTPHGTWVRRWTDIIDQIRQMGFNCIRMPFSGDTFAATPPITAFDEELNPEFVGKTAMEIMDMIIDYCHDSGLYVLLDHHRRNAGAGADGSPIGSGYTKAQWLATWVAWANRYKAKTNVLGADLHNEPHDHTWAEWAALSEECASAIHAVVSTWLIFVEGVGDYEGDNYWWGGQLMGVRTRPVVLGVADRLVYSPHTYGQSVGNQSWMSNDFQTVPGYPNNLYQVWDEHWGFIHYENIAPIFIGEMGGHFGLDGQGNLTKPHRVSETQWMTELVRYIRGSRGAASAPAGGRMSYAWWSFNPNSGDTGGLVQDDWATAQAPKLTLLAPTLT